MSSKGFIGSVVVGLVLLVGFVGALFCIERIPTGYVGVVYSMNGGVQDEILTQGWHLVSPTKKVKEFTVSNEQIILSKESEDEDNSFAVSTADNANIDISFQMSYKYDDTLVVNTFKNFRGMSGEDIVNNRVSTILRAKISEVTSDYTMMEIYSGNRNEINKRITETLNEELHKQFGLVILDASIVDVHPDAQLQQTIQDRVTAMQKKQQAEAEQETVKVQNETKILQAEAEAEANIIKAQGEAEANRILSNSITQQLLNKMEMEARQEHGWVTVNGATVVTTKE